MMNHPSNGVSVLGCLRPAFMDEELYLRRLFNSEDSDDYSSDWKGNGMIKLLNRHNAFISSRFSQSNHESLYLTQSNYRDLWETSIRWIVRERQAVDSRLISV